MPTTFTNGFYGGNPRVNGAGNHHDERDGVEEPIEAAYLNNLENAVVTTQTATNSIETAFNTLMSVLASGLSDNSIDISGAFPSNL